MSDALAALRAQNTRRVTLRADGDDAVSVPEGTPGAITFTLVRVGADRIRSNLLYAALGKDGYVAYAQWVHGQAQAALSQAQAAAAKADEPPPFDDTLPDDGDWRAHTVALEVAAEDALLAHGLIDPPYAEARAVLGPYRTALARALVQWDREVPVEKHP